jgi:hypothetical protein
MPTAEDLDRIHMSFNQTSRAIEEVSERRIVGDREGVEAGHGVLMRRLNTVLSRFPASTCAANAVELCRELGTTIQRNDPDAEQELLLDIASEMGTMAFSMRGLDPDGRHWSDSPACSTWTRHRRWACPVPHPNDIRRAVR